MLRLRDIMTTDLVTVSPELSLRDAMELFVSEHVSGAPVVAQNKVVGVISSTDLLAFAASSPDASEMDRDLNAWDVGESVSESRTDDPVATWFVEAGADEELQSVEHLSTDETHRAERDRFARHTVSEVMTADVCSLAGTTPVEQAADYMRQAAIHRVLVMTDGELEGIVSMKDIADAVADHKLTTKTYVFGENSFAGRSVDRRR
jgi:CBS domain-containing protein